MDKMIHLFKILINYQYKVNMIHWNAAGSDFDTIHETAEKYYELISKMIDVCAELIKYFNGVIPGMQDCIFTNDDMTSFVNREFNARDAYIELSKISTYIIHAIESASSEPGLLTGAQSKLSEFQYKFINESYKLNQRLKNI